MYSSPAASMLSVEASETGSIKGQGFGGRRSISRGRFSKPRLNLNKPMAMPTNAEWFSELPAKVQRFQFSNEEQAVLSRLQSPPSSSGSSKRLLHQASFEGSLSSSTDSITAFRFSDELSTESTKSQSSEGSTGDSAKVFEVIHNWHDRPHTSGIDRQQIRSLSAGSFSNRTPPVTIQPGSRRRIVPPVQLPTIHEPDESCLPRRPRVITPTSSPTSTSSCHYYMDPEARMKLKVYLGSPLKFDEALEYGFPSSSPATPNPHAPKATRPIIRDRTAINDHQNFLKYDDLDFLNHNDEEVDTHGQLCRDASFYTPDDDTSELGTHDQEQPDSDDADTLSMIDSPITPRDGESTRPSATSPWSETFFDRTLATKTTPTWTGNRDMTLRMTLTRPDLRASEEEIYGRQDVGDNDTLSSNLLALEPLPVLQDHSLILGAHQTPGTLGENSKVGGIWRKLRPRIQGKK